MLNISKSNVFGKFVLIVIMICLINNQIYPVMKGGLFSEVFFTKVSPKKFPNHYPQLFHFR